MFYKYVNTENKNESHKASCKVNLSLSLSLENKAKAGYHELLSEKGMVKNLISGVINYITSRGTVIFVTSHLMSCIEYYYNQKVSLRARFKVVQSQNPVN